MQPVAAEMAERFRYIEQRFEGCDVNLQQVEDGYRNRLNGEVNQVAQLLRDRQGEAVRLMNEVQEQVEAEQFLAGDAAEVEHLHERVQELHQAQQELQDALTETRDSLKRKVDAQTGLASLLVALTDVAEHSDAAFPVQGIVEEIGRRIVMGPRWSKSGESGGRR